jgi:hypothetical protein
MTKQQREFFAANDLPWSDCPGTPGVQERVLSRDDADASDAGDNTILTRLARWAPGLDTTAAGVIRHGYVEEVYLLEGELTDLTLGQTFVAGHYACRPVGMPHGPYRTSTGCVMLEIRYPGAP